MEDQAKKDYELAFLLKEETDAAGLVGALKAMGAEVRQEGPVRKIALAYEIEKHKSAWFGFVQFAMEPAGAKALEAALNLRAEVLRSMLITPPTQKERSHPVAPADSAAAASGTGSRPSARPYESKPSASTSLSNEALEKKIEEILK